MHILQGNLDKFFNPAGSICKSLLTSSSTPDFILMDDFPNHARIGIVFLQFFENSSLVFPPDDDYEST